MNPWNSMRGGSARPSADGWRVITTVTWDLRHPVTNKVRTLAFEVSMTRAQARRLAESLIVAAADADRVQKEQEAAR